jgi:hypothetical protein
VTAQRVADEVLADTAPPSSMIVRVITAAVEERPPELTYELAVGKKTLRQSTPRAVTTNHFVGREGGRGTSRDSAQRYQALCDQVDSYLGSDDHRLSPAEAWSVLRKVDRGGRQFGTLHSVLASPEPLRLWIGFASFDERGRFLPAPRREFVELDRAALFPLD